MKKIIGVILCMCFGAANAVPISYEGELFDGVTETGSISDPFDTGSDWWFFSANAGDVITIQADRLDVNLDPALYLYAGMQSDTSALSSVIAFADDELPVPGPYGDPLMNFNITSAGAYTVAVWDYASGSGAPFDYQITLNGANAAVPEPSIIALLGLGLAGFGFTRRKKA